MRVLGLALLLASVVTGQNIQLMVVEPDPLVARLVAAAADAGLKEAAARAAAAVEGADQWPKKEKEEDEQEDIEITVKVQSVEPGNVLDLLRQVCDADDTVTYAMLSGVGGGVALAQAAAARAGVPLLLAGEVRGARARWEALALYPRAELALRAARDLLREKGWRRAALLHAGSARAAAQLQPDGDDLQLFVRQLPARGEDALLRDLMLVLKKAGYVNFLVWSEHEAAVWVLDAAQRVGLLAAPHAYIVLSLELHTQDLEPFSHGGANITGLMFFDPATNDTINATKAISAEYERRLLEEGLTAEEVSAEMSAARFTAQTVPGPLLLAHDAALLAGRALRALRLPAPQTRGSCWTGAGAFHADTLLNYLRSEEDHGATGILSWEADGWRRNNILQVVELQRGGELELAGSWTEAEGLKWRRRPRPARLLPSDSMTNRTFRVLIAMNDPYVMERESTERMSGNERYEGFCIELIEKLAEILHFNYTFVEQEDGKYGGINKATGEWEGMLRTVKDDKDNITLAITDLTITEEREKAVDFTTPFMNLGIAILFRKPKPPEPELFAFLLPFSSGVWTALGLAYLGTSLMLYCVGRLCPEEWQNPYPCIEEPDALENQFTLGNALWFNLGAMLLQGSEIAPVGYSTRAVASVWWLFALVITSSYTANLATLLAKKSSTEIIKDVNDLAHNDQGITYGAKYGGSTYTFFEHSQSELFKEMYEEMKKQQMPKDNDAGIHKVMTEQYAFLMESTSIEYVVERNCLVYMVGDLLDSKGYGIAMRKQSPYRQELNLALLRLQESGVLREMKHTWWEERNGGGACKPVDDRESSDLKMNSFYGLFLVLVVGCCAGVLLSCGDLAFHTRRHPRDPDLTFWQNFAQELRFVFHFKYSAKPVKGPLIPPKTPSVQSSELEEMEPELDADDAEEPAADGAAAAAAAGAAGAAAGAGGARCESAQSGPRRRRRSSMHTASMRLARHAHAQDSGTPVRIARS